MGVQGFLDIMQMLQVKFFINCCWNTQLHHSFSICDSYCLLEHFPFLFILCFFEKSLWKYPYYSKLYFRSIISLQISVSGKGYKSHAIDNSCHSMTWVWKFLLLMKRKLNIYNFDIIFKDICLCLQQTGLRWNGICET